MSAAASLLSQLTHFAGVVMTPKRREATFRHIEFLRLSDRRVLLIIVTSEGDVQNRILHTDRTYSQSQLQEATNFFNRHYAGQPYDAVRSLLAEELKSLREDIVGLMTAAVEVGGAALNEAEALVVTGEKNLLAATDLASNMDRLRRLFELFEQKTVALAPPRRLAARRGRADLYRRRIGARPARRVQRDHRALRARRARHRNPRCHRSDAHGVRARDSDRRRHRQASVQRAHASDERLMGDAASHPNAGLIGRFYDALGRRDAPAMVACYAPDATFSDPVFPVLDAAGVAAMWTMLCARGKDLAVVASDIDASDSTGRAHWVATYTYSATGRRVENHIDATLRFAAG
jgi:ketosteroid isomerase-like protein